MSGSTLKPAADKLPLAVRKNVRDDWEAKKPAFEKKLTEMLGETWTISADTNLIYTNVTDESYASRLGSVITWYIDPLISNMRDFVKKYGDDGKQEINSLATSHNVAFGPQDNTEFSYGGIVIENGVLRLVYNAPDKFASNVSDISRDIDKALKKASLASGTGSPYDIIARNGVKEKYDPKIEAVRKNIETLTGLKGIVLNPNFEKNAEALSKDPATRDDWASILGKSSLEYFERFAQQLKSAGFEKDDMLQEGFQDVVSKGEISLRVVEQLSSGSYHEVKVEDGVLLIQTIPSKWWTNVSDVGNKILDIL